MSECVVRMEMPTKENPCKIAVSMQLDGWTFWICPILNARCLQPEGEDCPRNCPIICSLPEGYGDLIDRDALIDMVKTEDIALYTCFDSDDAYYSVTDLITILMMQKEIIKAKRKVDASDAVAPTDTPTDTPTVPAERRSE